MNFNKRKGISLIVLVITIIVMIVLATAVILSLSSSNIIERANEAKTKSDEKNMLQVANVAYSEYVLEKNLGKTDKTSEQYVKEKLIADFSQAELDKLSILSDGTIQILPVIPTGFTVSIYEGEQKISDGLVVYKTDSLIGITHDVAMTTYDQFVWIPVEDIEDFEIKDWGHGFTGRDFDYISEPYSGLTSKDETGEIAEYAKMKASVEKYGGFYIARYEAGKENINNTDIVVSKKNVVAWNNVVWGTSMTEVGTNGAVALARSAYPENESHNMVSTLCYSVQWDAAINFMKDVPNPNVPREKYIDNSLGMGWYKDNYETGNSTHKTGVDIGENALNRVKNIYDMAGNVWEWSMTAYSDRSDKLRCVRGGNYNYWGSGDPASYHDADNADSSEDTYGFRVALYIR